MPTKQGRTAATQTAAPTAAHTGTHTATSHRSGRHEIDADQHRALAEVKRVLRPGGRFAFFEHVAAPAGTWSRRLQRCWAPISRRFDAGCDPARETWRAIEMAGFREVDARWCTRRPAFGGHSRFLGGIAHV